MFRPVLVALILFLPTSAGCLEVERPCPENTCFPLTSSAFNSILAGMVELDALKLASEFEQLSVSTTSRFSESGITTLLVSPPLHPLLIDGLAPGQYDGHNHTLATLSEYEGVSTLNLIWEDYWTDNDFYDHNHLDRHGRHTFCQKVSPQIKSILES